jgi:hypothetical protein
VWDFKAEKIIIMDPNMVADLAYREDLQTGTLKYRGCGAPMSCPGFLSSYNMGYLSRCQNHGQLTHAVLILEPN